MRVVEDTVQDGVAEGGIADDIVPGQLTAEGRDTAWLSVSPTDVHPWMDAYGGDLAAAIRRLRTLVGLL